METFHCRWNVGTFQNLSQPGRLRLLYTTEIINEWSECPHYSSDRENECFFSENYTTIWKYYKVQLRSEDQTVLYDEDRFTVENIVRPDPPVRLNWALLNMSLTGTHFDVLMNWEPPQTADVHMGWMRLQYEVQYRAVGSDRWKEVGLDKDTQRSLYGLQTNVDHEVRVRCRMLGFIQFGEFSDSLFIHVPSKASRFPVGVVLIFAALCLVGVLMLIIVSKQQKLMVILLPPVPGPKIGGINPELLKKGKLAEMTSILCDHHNLRPDLYNNDPWVEFIELDIEEPSDRLTDMDTDCLMDRPSPSCLPLSIGFGDDDSGRASCCDPELSCDPEASPFHSLLSNRSPNTTASVGAEASEPISPIQTPAPGEGPRAVPGREDLYAQVTEVRPSGDVLLTPEEQKEPEKTASGVTEVGVKDGEEKQNGMKEHQPLVMNTNDGGYTSKVYVGEIRPELSSEETSEPCEGENSLSVHSQVVQDYQRPYLKSDLTPMPSLSPATVYTMVEGVDRKNSLLLTPNPAPALQLTTPKAMPTPDGYLTPDFLGDITP
ncbi:growth hormone receptor-like isoform X2 [Lampris incognitus]|nr:growth hormone receptor-like isoform X2 [Lampris incognitus]